MCVDGLTYFSDFLEVYHGELLTSMSLLWFVFNVKKRQEQPVELLFAMYIFTSYAYSLILTNTE